MNLSLLSGCVGEKWKWHAKRQTVNLGWGHTYTDVTSFKIPNNNDNHTIKSTALEKNKGKN